MSQIAVSRLLGDNDKTNKPKLAYQLVLVIFLTLIRKSIFRLRKLSSASEILKQGINSGVAFCYQLDEKKELFPNMHGSFSTWSPQLNIYYNWYHQISKIIPTAADIPDSEHYDKSREQKAKYTKKKRLVKL